MSAAVVLSRDLGTKAAAMRPARTPPVPVEVAAGGDAIGARVRGAVALGRSGRPAGPALAEVEALARFDDDGGRMPLAPPGLGLLPRPPASSRMRR